MQSKLTHAGKRDDGSIWIEYIENGTLKRVEFNAKDAITLRAVLTLTVRPGGVTS